MTDKDRQRFETARKIGRPALLRLRAEVLLEHGDDGTIPLSADERQQLERIAVNPSDDDTEFLGRFDRFYEED